MSSPPSAPPDPFVHSASGAASPAHSDAGSASAAPASSSDKPVPPLPPAGTASPRADDAGEDAAVQWGGSAYEVPPSLRPDPAAAGARSDDEGFEHLSDPPAWSSGAAADDEAAAPALAGSSASLPRAASPDPQRRKSARPTLPPGAHGHIRIVDALKSSDGGPSTFIVYHISLPALGLSSKRRYSEFEALRTALIALHPTRLVPPLPPKHSIGDYAAKQARAKEDAAIIARRRRLLGSFLERCATDPVLGKEDVLRRFCDGRESWHDISTSPPLSDLPKSSLRAPVRAPADPQASRAYAALPLPGAATPLRVPNARFADSEAFTNRWTAHVAGPLEKGNRRIVKRWGDSSADYAELGAVLNGFSLSEHGELAAAIERTGQAADGTFMSIGEMLSEWEATFTEPLSEYAAYGSIVQKLLRWRHLKHLQFELAEDAVEAKRLQLEELERIEAEAQRLQAALNAGGRGLVPDRGPRTGVLDGVNGVSTTRSSVFGTAGEEDPAPQPAATPSATPDWTDPSVPRASRIASTPNRRSGGGGLLGALSHTFHAVMDVDPDATRRNNIGKLREAISQLDEALTLTADDLRFATSAIQAALDGFQKNKVADFRTMFLAYARLHREFCRVNLANWQEARRQLDRVQAETAMPESSLVRHQRSEGSAPR